MKHAASRELYAYWEERRGTRPAPERAEIEPGAIRQVLSDTFILALDRRRGRPSVPARRHAGLRAVRPRAQGRVLRRSLGAASRGPIAICWPFSTEESVGTVAGVTAHSTDGEPLELELLLLPLGLPPAAARAHHRRAGAVADCRHGWARPDRRADAWAAAAMSARRRQRPGCCRASWRRAAASSSMRAAARKRPRPLRRALYVTRLTSH